MKGHNISRDDHKYIFKICKAIGKADDTVADLKRQLMRFKLECLVSHLNASEELLNITSHTSETQLLSGTDRQYPINLSCLLLALQVARVPSHPQFFG